MSYPPGILARGPWQADQVASRWREDAFEPPAARTEAADEAIAALEDRGSPAHDGLAARLAGLPQAADGRLELELQPMRWSLRLVREDASRLARRAVRDARRRRPLAGRPARDVGRLVGRAAGRSAPAARSRSARTRWRRSARELEEEWSVTPERLTVEALVSLPNRLAMLIGLAWLPDGAEVTRDAEHDAHAWWPRRPRGLARRTPTRRCAGWRRSCA